MDLLRHMNNSAPEIVTFLYTHRAENNLVKIFNRRCWTLGTHTGLKREERKKEKYNKHKFIEQRISLIMGWRALKGPPQISLLSQRLEGGVFIVETFYGNL